MHQPLNKLNVEKCVIALALLAATLPLSAQVAGRYALSVLDLPVSARTASLGLDYLPVNTNDISIAADNPSLIDRRLHNKLSLNVVNLFGGANLVSASYGYHAGKFADFVAGVRFHNYGRFDGYDEAETSTGKFFAADYTLYLGWGMHVDSSISIGVALKPTFSQYETYRAFALAIDMAGSYMSRNRQFVATVMGRNAGTQLCSLANTKEPLPFELSAAISYRLQNAPFRLFFAATELQRWNLRYDDPLSPTATTDPFTGERIEQSAFVQNADNIGRHAIVGIELSIKQLIMARLGFNYRQSKETLGTTRINTSGFSYGLGINTRKFTLDLGRNNYNLGKAANYITLVLSF